MRMKTQAYETSNPRRWICDVRLTEVLRVCDKFQNGMCGSIQPIRHNLKTDTPSAPPQRDDSHTNKGIARYITRSIILSLKKKRSDFFEVPNFGHFFLSSTYEFVNDILKNLILYSVLFSTI